MRRSISGKRLNSRSNFGRLQLSHSIMPVLGLSLNIQSACTCTVWESQRVNGAFVETGEQTGEKALQDKVESLEP